MRRNPDVVPPEDPLHHLVELVIDDDNNLVEVKRLPGENKVGRRAGGGGRLATPDRP